MKNKLAFLKLPKEIQILAKWFKWIETDKRLTGNLDTYIKYTGFRYWIQEEMQWNDLTYSSIPDVKNKMLKIWFEVDREVDKESLIAMEIGKQYQIKKRYNGWTAIEVNNS